MKRKSKVFPLQPLRSESGKAHAAFHHCSVVVYVLFAVQSKRDIISTAMGGMREHTFVHVFVGNMTFFF